MPRKARGGGAPRALRKAETAAATELTTDAVITRYPPPHPRGEVDAADHQGHEDGSGLEAAARPGSHSAGASVCHADAARAEQRREPGGRLGASAPRRAARGGG